ncbi:MerR-like DNA binding protein [Haloactinopolyspora alba]|uniref:MerR-like DNA binding protein n=1 Tax=Haloactinopolyspora alba TaxID=648780 RepID=A0A2P8E266_9ACTN|nr:MerR family transcriptional regulator [Haloactinopolyspora alba]PSL03571.1 MerR-like DNA binding protein [Haloactinopolyspora alba]
MSPAEARAPGEAGRGAARQAPETMSIGEVLAQLRQDFPDVSISKIRFLETEGLVEPQRSPSGYRRFTADDVARLRYVLTVQRDHYLPLRVIKEQLEQLDRGMELVTEGASTVTPYTAAGPASDPNEVVLSRSSLLEAAAITEELLAELESYGLVSAGRGGTYDAEALMVARTVGELAEFGLQPRHLRAVRTAAEREVDLVEQVVAPMRKQRGADAQGRADESADQVARLTVRLHAALVEAGIRRVRSR